MKQTRVISSSLLLLVLYTLVFVKRETHIHTIYIFFLVSMLRFCLQWQNLKAFENALLQLYLLSVYFILPISFRILPFLYVANVITQINSLQNMTIIYERKSMNCISVIAFFTHFS